MAARMKRVMGLTAKVSGWLKASPLERRVRPEGQKGAPSLDDVRSPRKTAGPRKRRSAARMIAGGAWLASAGGPKGLKAFGTGRSAETSGCAHRAGDGTNLQGKRLLKASPLERRVRTICVLFLLILILNIQLPQFARLQELRKRHQPQLSLLHHLIDFCLQLGCYFCIRQNTN